MQRPFERAQRAGNGRVHVRKCSGGDPRGKSGCVEFVVGMQDEGNIQRLLRGGAGLLAIQHPQKIGGVGERTVWRDRLLAFAQPVISGHDHGNLRSQPQRLAHIGVVFVVGFVRIVERKRRNRRAQHFHGQRLFGDLPHESDDRWVELALGG